VNNLKRVADINRQPKVDDLVFDSITTCKVYAADLDKCDHSSTDCHIDDCLKLCLAIYICVTTNKLNELVTESSVIFRKINRLAQLDIACFCNGERHLADFNIDAGHEEQVESAWN
jgi:hypothetical protein